MGYFFFTSPCAGGLGSTDARSGNTFSKYHLKFLQPSLLLSLSRSLMSPMSTFFSSSDFLLHKRNFSMLEMWFRTQQRVSHQFLKERKSRIYRLGEKSRVVKGDEPPRGSGAMPHEIFWNEYALICNLLHFEKQFWEMVQCVHWPHRVWMIFPI